MTLEEYQAELRRISETLAEQNLELGQSTALLSALHDVSIRVDPAGLAEIDDACQRVASHTAPGELGQRC